MNVIPWQPAMNDIYNYDALTFTRHLPAQSVQCVVTSPPYFGLRDYGAASQWGLEPTIDDYVGNLVALFREIRRALADDGTVWLNLGDSYVGAASQHKSGGHFGDSSCIGAGTQNSIPSSGRVQRNKALQQQGLSTKNLIGIPWRVALALQADGWYLRSDIVWSKNNPMPESVKDRPTRSHEYIFLLTKSPQYYYDHEAVAQPVTQSTIERLSQNIDEQKGSTRAHAGGKTNGNMKAVSKQTASGLRRYVGFNERYFSENSAGATLTRNRRTVWTINTQPFPDAHFAVFPSELPRLCIQAGSRPGDVVFDPFMGSGTTALVAREESRQFVGCDVNPEYVSMARGRLSQTDPFQSTVYENGDIQLSLWEDAS